MKEDIRLKYADTVSLERIAKLHPKVRIEVYEAYLNVNMKLPKGVRLRITQTLRTNAEQDALYAQGRTKPGSKVTNAKGGQSIHNYGLAFDFVILLDKDKNGTFESTSWNIDSNWMTVVNYFKNLGWSWGGDWKSLKDNPHLEKTFGNTWRTLINKSKNSDGYVII